jgi:hypothetical protein
MNSVCKVTIFLIAKNCTAGGTKRRRWRTSGAARLQFSMGVGSGESCLLPIVEVQGVTPRKNSACALLSFGAFTISEVRAVFKGGGVYGFNPPPEILEKYF